MTTPGGRGEPRLGAAAGRSSTFGAVALLQSLPNDVKVALVALVLVAFLAALFYLQLRSPRGRG